MKMKKSCDICKKETFLSNYKLKDGIICNECLLPFGLGTEQLGFLDVGVASKSFKNYSIDEIAKAVNGENEIFAEIRNTVFSDVPAGALLKFDGGFEDVLFAYEDKIIYVQKGFFGTKIGRTEKTILIKNVNSISMKKSLLGIGKKEFIDFLLTDGGTISVAYAYTREDNAIKFKELVESRIG